MKTGNHNSDRLLILMMELSIFFLLCIAILNAPHVKGQTIPARGNAIRQKVQEIYTSQIGIREKGINSGPAVAQYLSYVNLPSGNPWCAAFVCWVFGKANVPNPRTGWSPDLFKPDRIIWERIKSGTLHKALSLNYENTIRSLPVNQLSIRTVRQPDSYRVPTDNRQPNIGDVFGIYFPDNKRIAHAGFIDQWDGTWLITVEGNTTISGSREGDGVYRKRRPVKSIYQVAGYIPQP